MIQPKSERPRQGTRVVLYASLLAACGCASAALAGSATARRSRAEVPGSRDPVVTLQVDGVKRRVATRSRTVAELLQSEGATLYGGDWAVPGQATRVTHGMSVRVVRMRRQVIEKQVLLPCKTTYQFSKSLRPGVRRVIQDGQPGVGYRVVEVWLKDGVVASRRVIGTRVGKSPVDRIVITGERDLLPSRDGSRARRVVWMTATSYSPGPRSCGKHADGYTSIGLRAGYGVVAVDPRIIPLGSRLYIEGYGYAVAADVGGAIKGLKIDLGYDTHRRAIQFGRRRVKVYVLD